MPDSVLAQLGATAAILPTGQESRLERLATTKYVISFDDGTTEEAVFVIPWWPDVYVGAGTLKCALQGIMASATSGNIFVDVSLEAVTSGDSLDLDAGHSYDTVNEATVAVATTTAGKLFTGTVTLTNKDNVAAGDYVRVKVRRIGGSGSDTATGDYRLLGITLYESLDQIAVNTADPVTNNANSVQPVVVMQGTGTAASQQIVRCSTPGAGGALLTLSSTRGATATTYTATQSGDGCGTLTFSGADGTRYITVANILAQVDGAVGTDSVLGRVIIATSPGTGSNTVTERLRIDSVGAVILQTDAFLRLVERTTTPANPASGAEGNIYIKADKLVIQYNDGGTVRYKYLDLTGTGVTWTHTTSAP